MIDFTITALYILSNNFFNQIFADQGLNLRGLVIEQINKIHLSLLVIHFVSN